MVDLAQTIEEWKDIQSVKVDDQVRDGQKDKKTKRQKTKRQKVMVTIKTRNRFRKHILDDWLRTSLKCNQRTVLISSEN